MPYEEKVDPAIREFWEDLPKESKHLFAKHPVLALHGDKLSREAYEYVRDADSDMQGLMGLFQLIMQKEAPHKKQLEELAKDITVKIWGIDKDLLEANLTPDMSTPSQDEEDQDEEVAEISPELRDQVNKRITLNTMTQGAAVHQMMSMHFLIDEAIKKIDPELLDLYTKIAKGAVKVYWMINFAQMAEQMLDQQKAGVEYIDWSGDQPTVVGKAFIFPILAQELSKGIMELLTVRGHSTLDPEAQKTVIQHADKLTDEPWLIQVGPSLWRKFLQVVPKGVSLSAVVAAFSEEDPKDVHKIIDDVIDNPNRAKETLRAVVEGSGFVKKEDEVESYNDIEFNEEDFEF